jgi:hypothetical protein
VSSPSGGGRGGGLVSGQYRPKQFDVRNGEEVSGGSSIFPTTASAAIEPDNAMAAAESSPQATTGGRCSGRPCGGRGRWRPGRSSSSGNVDDGGGKGAGERSEAGKRKGAGGSMRTREKEEPEPKQPARTTPGGGLGGSGAAVAVGALHSDPPLAARIEGHRTRNKHKTRGAPEKRDIALLDPRLAPIHRSHFDLLGTPLR